jgi:hypothetical protein
MKKVAGILLLILGTHSLSAQAVTPLVDQIVSQIDAVGTQDWTGPGGVIRKVLDSLEGKKDRHPNKDLKVVLANFTYAQSGLGSPFSRFLEDQFSSALVKSKYFSLFPREVLTNLPAGLGGPYQGQLGAAEATGSLSGKFSPAADGSVTVDFQLADLLEGRVIGYGQVKVRKEWIPSGLALEPPAAPALPPVPTAAPGGLSVTLTTDRGPSGTYLDGEVLTLSVFASKDCWLKVYQIDGAGQVKLIFPNPYSQKNQIRANTLVRVPDGTSGFSFVMGAPYGVETIRAVASTVPFLDTETAFQDLGTDSPKVINRGLSVVAKPSGPAELAQAQVQYTVQPKS